MKQNLRLLLVRTEQLAVRPSRVFDLYVCAKAETLAGSTNQQVLYWQLVDPEFNLVEIGIDRHTGILLNVKVVLYKGELLTKPSNESQPAAGVIEGIPVFDRHLWQQSDASVNKKNIFFDVAGRCSISMVADSLAVTLFQDPIAQVVRIGKTLWCNITTEGTLAGFTFPELAPYELATLNDYFVFHRPK